MKFYFIPSTFRLRALAPLLFATLLTACATKPGTPDVPGTTGINGTSGISADPILAAVPDNKPVPTLIPSGPLKSISPGKVGGLKISSTEPPREMWDRIRRGFAMPDLQSELVVDREQWYSTRPEYIQRMTERSSKYLFHIVEELERRQMPAELALLPFIESAFNPQAVSSAKAAGMW